MPGEATPCRRARVLSAMTIAHQRDCDDIAEQHVHSDNVDIAHVVSRSTIDGHIDHRVVKLIRVYQVMQLHVRGLGYDSLIHILAIYQCIVH